MSTFQILMAALPAIALSGCCTARRCTAPSQTETKYSFDPEQVGIALSPPGGELADMLVLSGGGSHGAWGAGVLRGWRENPLKPRPKFRIVTGVSTGALLATYAFLGEDQDDDLLATVYTSIRTADIYRKKFILFALFSNSLMSSSPLKRTISNHIDMRTLERVATAGMAGRRLYVACASHDTGKLVIWDMTKIAMDTANPQRLELYRSVVFASASIPVAVPPVDIAGNLYCDGGTREQLFFVNHFTPAVRKLKAASKALEQQHMMVHVIINGQLGLQTKCVCNCLTDTSFQNGIAPRTLEMLLDANANGDLFRVDDFCKEMGAERRWCRIPEDYPDLFSSYDFVPAQMKQLYERGRDYGRTNDTWEVQLPSP